jgi:hypothetical protein
VACLACMPQLSRYSDSFHASHSAVTAAAEEARKAEKKAAWGSPKHVRLPGLRSF